MIFDPTIINELYYSSSEDEDYPDSGSSCGSEMMMKKKKLTGQLMPTILMMVIDWIPTSTRHIFCTRQRFKVFTTEILMWVRNSDKNCVSHTQRSCRFALTSDPQGI